MCRQCCTKRFTGRPIRVSLVAPLATLVLGKAQTVLAQGCVASRGTGMTPGQHGVHLEGGEAPAPTSGFQGSVGYRWLHSDRMFSHDVEQTQREADGSQEINSWSFSVNTPVALYRNRQQSVPEKTAGMAPVPAGFADFVVTCGVTKKF